MQVQCLLFLFLSFFLLICFFTVGGCWALSCKKTNHRLLSSFLRCFRSSNCCFTPSSCQSASFRARARSVFGLSASDSAFSRQPGAVVLVTRIKPQPTITRITKPSTTCKPLPIIDFVSLPH